jgi:hypothetical protein
MARNVILLLALVVIAGFAYLTFAVIAESGVDVLVVLALVLLTVMAFGILGALTTPPDDR